MQQNEVCLYAASGEECRVLQPAPNRKQTATQGSRQSGYCLRLLLQSRSSQHPYEPTFPVSRLGAPGGQGQEPSRFLNPTSTQQAKQRFTRQTDRDFISSLTPWISVRRQMRGTVYRRQVTLLLSLHNIVFYLCCGKLTYTLTWDVTFSTPVTHHKSPFPGASGKGEAGQGGPLL